MTTTILLPSETFPQEFSTVCQLFEQAIDDWSHITRFTGGIHERDIISDKDKDFILGADMDVVVFRLKRDLDVAYSLIRKCIGDRRDFQKDSQTIDIAFISFKLFIDRLRRHLKLIAHRLLEESKDRDWPIDKVILATKIMMEQCALKRKSLASFSSIVTISPSLASFISGLCVDTFIIDHIHALVSDTLTVEDIAAFMLLML
jgi:hypothetical protein